MDQSRAVVIGGGIGGLTAAVALHQRGWDVTVLERAASLAPVGAGLGLAPNAQRALDVIGLGDAVRDLAAWQGEGGLRAPDGRWLNRMDGRVAAERFGGPLVLLHRATLVSLLTDALPATAVRTGTAATLTDPGTADGRPAVVTTPEGETEAGLVVAADGLRSATRGTLFPAHPGPRYAGYTTWRTIVPEPERPFPPHETWGRGRVWGTQPFKDGRVYAYAMTMTPAGGQAPHGEKAELTRLFGDWHDPVPRIIAAAESDRILRHDVYEMNTPLPAFHRGRVALLGDAAHAMQPSLAQGGNQAIEDAVVLAHHVGAGGPGRCAAALAGYSADRLPRTSAVVRRAARASRMAAVSSPAGAAVRDRLIAAASRFGPGLVLRGMDGIADWRPPGRTYASGTSRP
ncbi:FAD-dependent monooxygenase [Streptomyces corynorhini]|uniref:FAD-dependent oxidoreductase n=1 Tax=Streptomyces corynorhini TaxID=2282652 RepID=A0A370AZU4_9ACTN|nr:FAD-dependent monooxygenase [Streptomyces corynorhini]RDG32615.1 FAD-dependent oxidoreductase [Streptomyces corynorhini]